MPKIRVSSFAISLDGYAAGPNQSLENPLGTRGPELFEWFFATRTWREMHGHEGGSTGVDDNWARRGMENVGAWILGRNMFGPVRGPWLDDSWKGWWGDEPPYHVPTFVLTHHPRHGTSRVSVHRTCFHGARPACCRRKRGMRRCGIGLTARMARKGGQEERIVRYDDAVRLNTEISILTNGEW